MRTAMDLRVQLSSCVPATNLETSGARLEVGDLLPLADHPKVLGLAEFMNFPGLLARDPSCLAKLAAFQTRPIDGHSPLLGGLRPQRLPQRGRANRPRGHQPARGAREADEGHAGADQGGLGVQGPACACAHHHRAQFALHRLLHRRPQSARHRRGRPPRFPDPHRDRARRAAARRLSRCDDFRRAHFRPARPRACRARLASRPRRDRRSRALRCLDGACGGTRGRRRPLCLAWAAACSRARKREGAPCGGQGLSGRAGRAPRPRRSASFRARSSPIASP